MKKLSFSIIVFYILTLTLSNVRAQSIPVGTYLDDYYRRMQLLGWVDSTISYSVRPLHTAAFRVADSYDPDSSLQQDSWIDFHGTVRSADEKFLFRVLPVTWKQQVNSHHPYGWNDGAMIPAKGYQTLLTAGFYAEWGPLSVQLQPEYLYATNKAFETLDRSFNADFPEHFGSIPYSKVLWGQSSARLTVGPASLGLSNENLWWGPGKRNSLLMTNNAEGFKHVTLNTVRPISTPIGSFEAQFIGGALENSGEPHPNENFTYPKNEWRYLSAMNVNYQPKWLPGLFLGLARAFYAYKSDLRNVGDYVPFLTPFQKVNTNDGDPFPRDQLTSLYARWVFTKAKAEVYVEYGLNDNAHDLRDFINAPDHSRSYIVGLSKLVPLPSRQNEFIEVNMELNQTSQSIDQVLRNSGNWYTHSQVKHGYTHMGQIIGAGIGLGGNLQSIDVRWVKGFKTLGIGFERFEHNDSNAPVSLNKHSRRWVDFAFGATGTWSYKNLLINAKLQGIKSLNYQWKLAGYTPDEYYIPHNDLMNFHGELGVAFRF